MTDVDIVGVATDCCDRTTALEERSAGSVVRIHLPLPAGVARDMTAAALEAGVVIVTGLPA